MVLPFGCLGRYRRSGDMRRLTANASARMRRSSGGNGINASTCSISSESAIAPSSDNNVPSTIRPPNISW